MDREEILDKLACMSTNMLNGDYCRGCWKFDFCQQVPFSLNLFKPCKALIMLQEDIDTILDECGELIE